MANTKKRKVDVTRRMFVYTTAKFREYITAYSNSDSRFGDRSKCIVHLLNLGLKCDKKDRDKSLKSIKLEK